MKNEKFYKNDEIYTGSDIKNKVVQRKHIRYLDRVENRDCMRNQTDILCLMVFPAPFQFLYYFVSVCDIFIHDI